MSEYYNSVMTIIILPCTFYKRFSRLYYSWSCVRTIDDVLLMCQFTDLVRFKLRQLSVDDLLLVIINISGTMLSLCRS